ncbi:DEAD-box ATP-dependent DNA helicase Fancm [Eurosta solidaginis]|uniref:DEAD-box ATP-dependent DNA helicase Fancm n=1 Tax=Eurosta solidaginis TaxID=178769 RepID=UPI0035311C7A
MDNTNDISGSSDTWCDLTLDDEDLQNIMDAPIASQSTLQLRTGEQHVGFDNNVGDTWLYPNNLPQRSYQLSITKAALFNNTLVVLPTGLGKTFIAAVVMYNIYRWYPASKIIFMAPTRPLVAQQIEACQRVMPFPDEDTIELTGRLPRTRRAELWHTKRVFFATPQVVQSDISGSDDGSTSRIDLNFPFDQVKLIVVDEAHRAKGRYAYTEVVQVIKQHNSYFRVLALSATPGRTMDDIAEVVRNLLIAHIEVRSDTSIDVMPYVHRRNMKTVVVPLNEDLKALHAEVLAIVDPYLRQLIDANVLSGSLAKISRNFLLFEQKRFRDRSQQQNIQNQAAISTNFSICISMYHALELLERHGMRVFQNYFEEDEEGRSKFVVNMEPKLRRLLDRLRDKLGPNPFEISTHPMTNGQIPKVPSNLDFGHPKFDEARKYVLEHFQTYPDSRAIVFCEYRESVMLIFRLLLQHVPLLKPRYFVGQGAATGSLRPLTQKEQIQIMQDFRSGKNNILVATSIGEEGIDVGEVELIVCFDMNTSNPRRFIQRIGRTGRQKQGNVVVLVTEGREEQILKEVLAQKNQTNAKIQHSLAVRQSLYKYSPRLVPTELDPKVLNVFIKPTTKDKKKTATNNINKEGKSKNIPKKSKGKEVKSSQDLRAFFKKKTSHPASMLTVPSQHGLETQENINKCLSNIDDYFKEFEAPVTTNTQLLAPTPVSHPSAHTSENSPQKSIHDSQLFCTLKKLMEKNSSIIPSKELITDPIEQLKSSKVSDDGKRFILRAKPSIVSDILEKFKVLEVLAQESEEMTAEEKEIRKLYSIIEKLLGGTRVAVEMFIDDAEIEDMAKQQSIPSDICDVNDDDYKAVCDAVFDGLEEQDILCDNFDYIEEEFKKTEYYKQLHAERSENNYESVTYTPMKNIAESMIYETVVVDDDMQSNSITNASMSTEPQQQQPQIQTNCLWDDFARNAPSTSKSTPLMGPLAKAFQRQQKKNYKKSGSFLKRLDASCSKLKKEIKHDSEVIYISETESTMNIADSLHDLDITEQATPSKKKFLGSESKNEPTSANIVSELDLDIEAFLEPFPEESEVSKEIETKSEHSKNSTSSLSSSQKENENTSNLLTPKATKVQANISITPRADNDAIACGSNRHVTPPPKVPMKTEEYVKSPSLYEMYLKNIRKRSRLPEHIQQSVSFAENQVLKALSSTLTNEINANSTTTCDDEKSIIVPSKTLKRKLISSSDSNDMDIKADAVSETDCEDFLETQTNMACMDSNSTANNVENIHTKALNTNSSTGSSVIGSTEADGSETECEEVAATQKPKRPLRIHRRLRRLHPFIIAEAVVSGNDDSEYEETEMPCSQYAKDSMVVSSDGAEASDENAPTATQMQAHYLQTVKSPTHVPRGAFKIPVPRKFNDHSKIYSQAVPVAESQYVCDSFVVHEEDIKDSSTQLRDQTMSPLERAERILKERRRARRKFKEVAKIQRRRRICEPVDSSDEEN